MSDQNLVACEEEHEIKYILEKFDQRQTQNNILTLQGACRAWKDNADYQPHNRDSFYRYIEEKEILAKLESS